MKLTKPGPYMHGAGSSRKTATEVANFSLKDFIPKIRTLQWYHWLFLWAVPTHIMHDNGSVMHIKHLWGAYYVLKIVTKRLKRGLVRYVVYPGLVRSRSDGDMHYITADQLIRLYGVPPCECIVVDVTRPNYISRRNLEGLIPLSPQYSGDYTLKEK